MIGQADAGAPAGRRYYEKACTLPDLSDQAIEALVEYGTTCTSPFSQVLIQHVHGAASRVDPAKTAFALRGESYVVSIVAAWEEGEVNRHIAWTRACWKALEPFTSSGVYINFLGNEGEGPVRAAYGVNYERLVALKNTYDPTNFFAGNQNIKPVTKEEELCFTRL
jgi:Berberine and berberine like